MPTAFVTAYAHASEVMVKRGDQVKRGQIIAKAGQTGGSPRRRFTSRSARARPRSTRRSTSAAGEFKSPGFDQHRGDLQGADQRGRPAPSGNAAPPRAILGSEDSSASRLIGCLRSQAQERPPTKPAFLDNGIPAEQGLTELIDRSLQPNPSQRRHFGVDAQKHERGTGCLQR